MQQNFAHQNKPFDGKNVLSMDWTTNNNLDIRSYLSSTLATVSSNYPLPRCCLLFTVTYPQKERELPLFETSLSTVNTIFVMHILCVPKKNVCNTTFLACKYAKSSMACIVPYTCANVCCREIIRVFYDCVSVS